MLPLRRYLGALVLASIAGLTACQDTAIDPAGTPELGLVNEPSDGTLEVEGTKVCKYGSTATFDLDYAFPGGGTDYQQITLDDGECRLVAVHDYTSDFFSLTVTEQVPAGYQLDSVVVEWLESMAVQKTVVTNTNTVTRDLPPRHVFRFYNSMIPTGEGCTPGFWRNHLDDWAATGYSPDDDFDTTFGTDYFSPDITLGQAVNLGGGGIKKVARHGAAALLNAAHPDVDYPLTVAEVIAAVQAGDVDAIVVYNELLAPGFCN